MLYCLRCFTMLVVALLFILTPFCFECYNVRRVAQDEMKNEIENIFRSYMKPLTANFPNHEVEVQVEYSGSLPPQPQDILRTPRKAAKRRVYIFKPRSNHIGRAADNIIPTTTQATTTTSPATSTATATSTTTTTIAPTFMTTTTTPRPPIQPKTTSTSTRKPVYMEDLMGALEAFEKKIKQGSTKQEKSTTAKPVYMEDLTKALGAFEKKLKQNIKAIDDSTKRSVNRNVIPLNFKKESTNQNSIEDIVRLLRSNGVKLQRNVPKPVDKDLEWMRIKIPKDQMINV